MLKLRGSRAVSGHGSPVVRPQDVAVASEVNHGLNGEDMAWLHGALGLILGVVGHIGGRVEEGADAVAAVGGDNRALGCLGHSADRLAQITT